VLHNPDNSAAYDRSLSPVSTQEARQNTVFHAEIALPPAEAHHEISSAQAFHYHCWPQDSRQPEDAFWNSLRKIADRRGETVSALVASIDKDRRRHGGNLSSAIRLFILRDHQHRVGKRKAAQLAGRLVETGRSYNRPFRGSSGRAYR
jgi:predicted DNA-binding ribbon-helix-helix protein